MGFINTITWHRGLCIGCMRTRDECKGWKKMKDKHRTKIIEDRPRRERKLKK
ncbi:DUF1289 domain-containing protein [Paraburkholderia sp. 40]|uniref:DUF1289 domain-containing protein n=1 Tax=unclassified Paraburkholderia TaxID=2615204 RepID=UPI003D247ED7